LLSSVFSFFSRVVLTVAGFRAPPGTRWRSRCERGDEDDAAAEHMTDSSSDARAVDAGPRTRSPRAGSGAPVAVRNGRDQCGGFPSLRSGAWFCVEWPAGRRLSRPPAAHCLAGRVLSRVDREMTTGGGWNVRLPRRRKEACYSTDYELSRCLRRTRAPAQQGRGVTKASGDCVGCTADADLRNGSVAHERTGKRTVCRVRPRTRPCPEARDPRCRALTGACVACTSNDDCGHAVPDLRSHDVSRAALVCATDRAVVLGQRCDQRVRESGVDIFVADAGSSGGRSLSALSDCAH